MNNIIYITGETAQGKTTLAKQLSGYLNAPVIQTDHCYNYMHFCEKTEKSRMYLNTIHHNKNKEFFYKVLIHHYPKEKTLIFEGASLASERERKFIESIFKPKKTMLFLLTSEDWVERSIKKHGQEPSEWYKNWFKSISNLEQAIKVKNIKELFKHCESLHLS
jgi:shikimate kinase